MQLQLQAHIIDKMYLRAILFFVTIPFLQKYCHCSNPCSDIDKCGKCIQNPECGWCLDEAKRTRCLPETTTECRSKLITGKGTEYIEVLKDEPLSSMNPSVQIKPQKISLNIPNNHSYSIKFEFARAWNSLDLYFLTDNSKTMAPHREMLSSLGNTLMETMAHLTTDFKMGYGSFVDKRISPFGFHEKKILTCDQRYSYMNHLRLTNDTTDFQKAVNERNSSCNLDGIEGGLDALAQVLVCGDEIGWRHESTHIVVLSTDAELHIAGDGKFGGVSAANDGRCHMSAGEYLADQVMDYPSVSHIGHLMEENNIYVIFAIVCNMTETMCLTYEELPHHTSKELAKFAYLDLNSTNVVTIINDTYHTILKSINMTHNSSSEIDVKFRVYCNGTLMDSDSCSDLKQGQKVEFEVILHPRECLNGTQTINIQPAGIKDYLQIELNVLCSCDCESNGPQEFAAEQCNFHGNVTCGLCECDEGYSGRNCMCSSNSTHSVDDSECINPNTNLLCSDSGYCVCGTCQCENNFYGRYCQCQDYNCPKKNSLLCSGSDHGKCECGVCKCNKDWTGDDCSCTKSTELCQLRYRSGVCSNRGNCTCGICECNEGFYGAYCEGCVVKENDQNENSECDRCKSFVNCVLRFNNQTVDNSNETNINCSAIRYSTVTANYLKLTNVEWESCTYAKDSCTTTYRFKESGNGGLVIEVGPEVCVFMASIKGLLTMIGATLVLAFITLLIWKWLITVNDNREFANFLEKRKMEKWHNDNNPLYKDPSQTYKNPMYVHPET